MPLSFTKSNNGAYQVATPVYQGPMDLLLQLIERAELDITKLALAQITDQYLEYIKNLKEQAAEEVSAFLVIAARLLQIKSEALLPRQPVRELGEEDPGDALVRQLLAYKRYKEIAGTLSDREAAGLRTYFRIAPPPKIDVRYKILGLELDELVAAAREAFTQADQRPDLNSVVAAPIITIREKIGRIVRSLQQLGRVKFQSLLKKDTTRMDVVVTFLAMLELVKQHFVEAKQESNFAEITLETTDIWEDEIEFELEFGE
jgi:segregation and condensation protein A